MNYECNALQSDQNENGKCSTRIKLHAHTYMRYTYMYKYSRYHCIIVMMIHYLYVVFSRNFTMFCTISACVWICWELWAEEYGTHIPHAESNATKRQRRMGLQHHEFQASTDKRLTESTWYHADTTNATDATEPLPLQATAANISYPILIYFTVCNVHNSTL